MIVNINSMAAELIKLAGSQTAAADLSGISQSNLSKLASGASGPGVKADTSDKIKKALTKLRRSARRNADA